MRPGNDAGDPGYLDAWRPDTGPRPDAGPPPPPTCGGTPIACADRTQSQCTDGDGCRRDSCRGAPSCIHHSSASSCYRDSGCTWDGTLCQGTPDGPCSSWTNATDCFESGCTWNDFDPPCVGTATPCASLHDAACVAQPGCHALDLDAGAPDTGMSTDAGARDTGAHDAGTDAAASMCTVSGGTCSPFSTSTCGANQTCIANGAAPHCTVSAFTLHGEGEACAADNECAWGLECHSFDSGVTFRCVRFCHAGSTTDCTGSTRCSQLAYTGSTCLRLCAPMPPACDLATQNCATGSSCYIYLDTISGSEMAGCYRTGSIAVGGSCTYLNDCVRGASCLGSGGTNVCRQTCSATTDCTAGGGCTGVTGTFHYCI